MPYPDSSLLLLDHSASRSVKGGGTMTALWEHRRLVLSLTLCLVLALFAAMAWRIHVPEVELGSHASSAIAPPAMPPTFLFHVEGFPQGPLHRGERVHIQWFPASAARPNAASG